VIKPKETVIEMKNHIGFDKIIRKPEKQQNSSGGGNRRWSNFVRPLDRQEGDVLGEGEIRSGDRSIHTLHYQQALNVKHDVEHDSFKFK
jgi:hypothetical protein